MNNKILALALGFISISSMATNTNQEFTLKNNNLFKNEAVLENKLQNLEDKKIGKLSSYYLNNGMKVILLPFNNHNKTGVYFTVRVGGKNEGYGETGMAHLLEHMLFKSTTNFSDLKKELTNLGAQWNGFTSHDQTTFFEIFNDDKENNKLQKVLSLESERFFAATFTKEDLSKEMTVVRNELERNASSPQQKLWEETLNKTFDWYGYKHAVIGEKSDIENAPFYKLKEFYNKYYQPKNTFLIVYGNFDESKTKKKIEYLFEKYTNKDNYVLNNWTQEPITFKNSTTTIYSSDEVMATNITWKAPNFIYDSRAVSAGLLFSSISQEPYGSLYKKYLLDKKDKNNKFLVNISTFNAPINDYSPLFIQIQQSVTGNNVSSQNIESIIQEVESGNIFNKENFEETKKNILIDYKKIEANPDSFAKNILQHEGGGDWSLFFHEKDLVKSATYELGLEFIKEYVNQYNRNVVTIQKDSKVKDSQFFQTANKINSKHYRNELVDKLNQVQAHEFNFESNVIDVFEPSLSNLKNHTEIINLKDQNKNLKLSLVNKSTSGDYVYFSLSNLYGNEDLQSKYRDSCQLLEIVPTLGGKNYDKEKLDKIMNELEADYSITFSDISLKVPKKNFAHSLHILFNVLINPSFDEKEFNRVKEQMLASIESLETNQDSINKEKLAKLISPYDYKHPLYSFSNSESLKIINNASIDNLKSCFNTFKGLINSHVSIVGDINKQEVTDSLKPYINWVGTHEWKRIKDDKIKEYSKIIEENKGKSLIILDSSNKPNSFNYKIAQIPMNINNSDYFKLKLALNVFGENSNSRIFKNLREKNGLSYTAQGSFQANYFSDKATIKTYAISSVSNADKTNSIIDNIWNDFIQNGITQEELDSAINNLQDQRKMSLSEDSQIVGVNMFLSKNEKDLSWLEQHDEKISNVKIDDVNKVVDKYLKNVNFISVYNR